jgi:hypothetical protein
MHIHKTLGVGRVAGVIAAVVMTFTFWPSSRGRSVGAPKTVAEKGAKSVANEGQAKTAPPQLKRAYRFDRAGWIYVHLEGTPAEIGYQHGYLLAPEIKDAYWAIKLIDTHNTKHDWEFFRRAAREMLWPKIEPEYQEELKGILEGIKAKGVDMDLDDVVALNAFEELPDYYTPWYDSRHKVANAAHLASPGNCSAFVATGSWTRGRQIVMAHNAWTSYLEGERWRIIFDIVPQRGYRIFMDGFPGVITSDDDFGVNSGGLMVTETTITQFSGWNPDGIPEFVRSRKALQYASSIDDYVRIMVYGNNGGYANDWLLGDRKTGEIAQFELGLKNHRVWRTRDGYFAGSNFASDPKVISEETTFDAKNALSSPNARRARWEELMKQYKGQIDVALAQRFLGDHEDVVMKRNVADEHTLCGHVDEVGRGVPEWDWGPYYPGGAVQGKATDSTMTKAMSFVARMGHPCGHNFYAEAFLHKHREYGWQAPLLRDMKAGPWTTFKAGEK